jgi:ATP-binding cassette subfamily B protein
MSDHPSRAASWGDVFRFYFAHWGRQPVMATMIVVIMTLGTLADVATPIYAGRLVDAVGNASRTQGRGQALAAIAGIALLGLFGLVTRQLAFWGIVRFTLRMMQDIKSEAFARVQRFSAAWHAESFAGSIVRQVLRGASAVDMLNDVVMLGLLPTAVVIVGAAIILGVQWPLLGLAVVIGGTIHLAITTAMAVRWVAPASVLSNLWDTRVSGALADAVTCNAVVKAFGAEHREDARLSLVLNKWSRRTRRTWLRGGLSYSAQTAALLVLQLLITGTATLLWWRNEAGAGDIAAVLTTYFVLHGYLRDMGQNVRQLQRSVADMQELVALHQTPLTVADQPGATELRVTGGRIDVRNIGFRYGAHGKHLFHDLSISIRAGERVGLVGPSGSGKSTFVRLIQRMHDIDAGRIDIDGQDIATVTQTSLRSQIAIVPQDPALFHRTLGENIAYANPSATQDQIEEAARLASAHDFIARLPKGYGTLVGERGVKLSGGERQRVAIARAFLADAPILIMDEATSSLDSESEAAIQAAMQRLLERRTAIVIAHRLSTIRAMDRILVFDHGRVVEEGTHDALVRRDSGIYRRLFERQALGLVTAG